MSIGHFKIFPSERMDTEFPWAIWVVGWLALFKSFLWLAYEPVQAEPLLKLLGTKFLLNIVPLAIFAVGVWNLRKWAMWGLIIVSIANLIFFVFYPQTFTAFMIESEVYLYSIILSFIALLCNGPLGDFFILCAAPSMMKHSKK